MFYLLGAILLPGMAKAYCNATYLEFADSVPNPYIIQVSDLNELDIRFEIDWSSSYYTNTDSEGKKFKERTCVIDYGTLRL